MPYVLLVEDSTLIAPFVKSRIEKSLSFKVLWATSFAQAKTYLDQYHITIPVALVDLYLPDAPNGEIVDFINGYNIPSIVFTGEFNEETREKIWKKGIVDYVIKRGTHNLDYIVTLIKRVLANRTIKSLVVDDQDSNREFIAKLLKVHQYNVFEAKDGLEALKILQTHPDIKLLITDYHMPNVNGFELTQRIRQTHSKDQLAIIGLSGTTGSHTLSARFIKFGANDFINRPFIIEEFYCRITQNIEIVEQIQTIKESSNRDYLTGIFNRKYFFETGTKLVATAKRKQLPIAVAMIDFDHFKRINDDYGHAAGDAALQTVAKTLSKRFRESDIVARFGGEEFCILLTGADRQDLGALLEKLRSDIEKMSISVDSNVIKLTVSIGASIAGPSPSLQDLSSGATVNETINSEIDDLITRADSALYQAKNTGRNRVVFTD